MSTDKKIGEWNIDLTIIANEETAARLISMSSGSAGSCQIQHIPNVRDLTDQLLIDNKLLKANSHVTHSRKKSVARISGTDSPRQVMKMLSALLKDKARTMDITGFISGLGSDFSIKYNSKDGKLTRKPFTNAEIEDTLVYKLTVIEGLLLHTDEPGMAGSSLKLLSEALAPLSKSSFGFDVTRCCDVYSQEPASIEFTIPINEFNHKGLTERVASRIIEAFPKGVSINIRLDGDKRFLPLYAGDLDRNFVISRQKVSKKVNEHRPVTPDAFDELCFSLETDSSDSGQQASEKAA